jgi:echinoderm microtubule-associated protein-like 1/2
LLAVDDANEHVVSVWEWQKGDKGHKITEAKVCVTGIAYVELVHFVLVCSK